MDEVELRELRYFIKPGTATELLTTIIQRCAREPGMPEVHILFGHPGGPAAAVAGFVRAAVEAAGSVSRIVA